MNTLFLTLNFLFGKIYVSTTLWFILYAVVYLIIYKKKNIQCFFSEGIA